MHQVMEGTFEVDLDHDLPLTFQSQVEPALMQKLTEETWKNRRAERNRSRKFEEHRNQEEEDSIAATYLSTQIRKRIPDEGDMPFFYDTQITRRGIPLSFSSEGWEGVYPPADHVHTAKSLKALDEDEKADFFDLHKKVFTNSADDEETEAFYRLNLKRDGKVTLHPVITFILISIVFSSQVMFLIKYLCFSPPAKPGSTEVDKKQLGHLRPPRLFKYKTEPTKFSEAWVFWVVPAEMCPDVNR